MMHGQKKRQIAGFVWIGLVRSAMALLLDALNLEQFKSPHFKNKFSVAGFLCVHILKQIFHAVVVGT